ncbi:ABC-2 type transport system ATP-binding protein [Streptomyces sp. DconLS]|uniref:ABC transporter ATP-binding protein n=1 Tax=Streptomyces sp. LamerLS-31b TaxID=1839765 RepID=UPI00081D529F|nr:MULTISPECIES: ABC transporter ATP-binding protein [unclassified Streptomyces]SCF58746.1 ABC-2 type transport system ATP-binding protein [Streptomyces sp. LamerLS-31b]SCG02272.1 ABC-2 type transport system ATP-binding protein [Streptomyces sp. DconLS]
MMKMPEKSPADAAVSVSGLRMSYGSRDVLRGIDLTIRQGELFALLGPNGAGKTTTVEILEGYRKRSAGEVRVLGTDPSAIDDAWRRRVGVVMQSWRDHARWRVRELMAHFAGYYPRAYAPDELLELVGLREQADQELGRLSGGQRRRVDVALGIIGRPELLFLDEPTTGFDPQARRTFHELILSLKDAGMTILLTTHDLEEAERLADRTAILIRGCLVACGTPTELAQKVQASAQVRWTAEGITHNQATHDPSQLVWELHEKFGGPIPDLEVIRPSLKDTYLSLVRAEGAEA